MRTSWSTLTATRYCLCGASLTVRSSPASVADHVLGCFDNLHLGDGHGPASQAQAARARRKAEQEQS